jgi:hypothetical protein
VQEECRAFTIKQYVPGVKKLRNAAKNYTFLMHQMCVDYSALAYADKEEVSMSSTVLFVALAALVCVDISLHPPRANRTRACCLSASERCLSAHHLDIEAEVRVTGITMNYTECQIHHFQQGATRYFKKTDRGYDFELEDFKQEMLRGSNLTCTYCGLKGATMGCQRDKCKKMFHFPCLKPAGCVDHTTSRRSFCCSDAYVPMLCASACASSRDQMLSAFTQPQLALP